jgi:hypothetical protein
MSVDWESDAQPVTSLSRQLGSRPMAATSRLEIRMKLDPMAEKPALCAYADGIRPGARPVRP